jgi:Putative DNA-binding domain
VNRPLVDGQTLREKQLWFAGAMTRPASERETVVDNETAELLTAGPRLTALERFEIYRRGYYARLVECLADDYPALQHALGEESFDSICRTYIARFPSHGPSLNAFGRHMPVFCGDPDVLSALSVPPGFAADLAKLEWAIVEVIHAPSSPPLTLDDLREIQADAWAGARLAPNTALRLLRLQYPVNAYFQAFRDGNDPRIPSTEASATAVYRSGPTVWRWDLSPAMIDVLSALIAGETLGESLARAAPHVVSLSEAEATGQVMGWFREWVASGLFVTVAV